MNVTELHSYLANLLRRIDGLQGVFIADRAGTELLRVTAESFTGASEETSLASLYSVAAGQMKKLALGKTKAVATVTENYLLVHLTMSPLIVTLLGLKSSNLGLLMNLTEDLAVPLASLRTSVSALEDSL